MIRPRTLISTFAVVALTACSHTPPAATPAPGPSEADVAMERHVQDSLNAIASAVADSTARAAATRQALADSVNQARMAAEALVQAATAQNEALRTELGVMIYFDTDVSKLQPDGQAALDRKIAILASNPDVRLRITGATDERGSTAYNMALGERRAGAAKKYLIAKGVDASRLELASAGEGSPIETGSDEAAWSRNRRAEFVLVGSNAPLAMR